MGFNLWICQHELGWAPRFVQGWRTRYIARVGEQRIVARVAIAQAQGIGITDHWVAAGTPATEILAWFDSQMAATPRVLLDLFRMVIAQCNEGDCGQLLPASAILVRWQGLRAWWWSAGREQLQSAIPADQGFSHNTCKMRNRINKGKNSRIVVVHDPRYTTHDLLSAVF